MRKLDFYTTKKLENEKKKNGNEKMASMNEPERASIRLGLRIN
jgi:hypothetical protein